MVTTFATTCYFTIIAFHVMVRDFSLLLDFEDGWVNLEIFGLFQLYGMSDEPERREFLDDLFSFMQKKGKWIALKFIFYILAL